MKATLTCSCILFALLNVVQARAADVQEESITELRKLGSDYVAAFNANDAEALAAFWASEAVYTNRLSGEQVVGRDAIKEQFEALFASNEGIRVEVDVESIEFVSPNVALENGRTTFLDSQSDPESLPYSAVYIRRDGKWLLDRVTDKPEPIVLTHYDQLKSLEWMVGTWADDGGAGQVRTECNWTKNRNFLTRRFTVSVGDRIDLTGIQFIGWDPIAKGIRSWTFDSDGGFAQGHWTRSRHASDGEQWFIRKKGTTADGSAVTAVNVLTLVDDDAFELKSVQRTLAGEPLPNIPEIMVLRD